MTSNITAAVASARVQELHAAIEHLSERARVRQSPPVDVSWRYFGHARRLTSTHFVGRVGELAELEAILRDAASRVRCSSCSAVNRASARRGW